jgi:hypothetical protein
VEEEGIIAPRGKERQEEKTHLEGLEPPSFLLERNVLPLNYRYINPLPGLEPGLPPRVN